MLPDRLRNLRLMQSRTGRTVCGWSLVAGGVLGFLPVLGFWMLPLGLVILSVDHSGIRRGRRRMVVWWGRRRRERAMQS